MIQTVTAVSKPNLAAKRTQAPPRASRATRRGDKGQNPGADTSVAIFRVDPVDDRLSEKALLAWEAFMAE